MGKVLPSETDFHDAGLPSPPDPVITRWATWLGAALYYNENLSAVRTIVNNWTSAGLLVSRAKDAINVEDLVPDLVKINQYRTLAANVEFLEGSACTITEAYGLLKNMQFDDDPCAIKNYIKKRLSNSDLETIINCTNLTIDPTSYALLQKAQPTSAAVERLFSMLSKLLRKYRNFDAKNVKKYMMLYYNKKSWQLYCVAFVKNIIDRLLMYSTVFITTHFLYYTLIDTGTHNGSLS